MSKAILNDSNSLSVAFFPARLQHREVKAGDLSYEDDYKGNAMAATISSGKVEIRFHQAFSDARVRELAARLKNVPELAALKDCRFSYQGRSVD